MHVHHALRVRFVPLAGELGEPLGRGGPEHGRIAESVVGDRPGPCVDGPRRDASGLESSGDDDGAHALTEGEDLVASFRAADGFAVTGREDAPKRRDRRCDSIAEARGGGRGAEGIGDGSDGELFDAVDDREGGCEVASGPGGDCFDELVGRVAEGAHDQGDGAARALLADDVERATKGLGAAERGAAELEDVEGACHCEDSGCVDDDVGVVAACAPRASGRVRARATIGRSWSHSMRNAS